MFNEYLSDETRIIASATSNASKLPLSLTVLHKALIEITNATPGYVGSTSTKPLAKLSYEIHKTLVRQDLYGTLANTISNVRGASNQLRERLSPELMRVLNDLEDNQHQIETTLADINDHDLFTAGDVLPSLTERFEAMLVSLAAFTGLVQENLTHGDNWRFITMGKRIERAHQSASMIKVFMQNDRDNTRLLEILLHLFDSTITYRTRYRSTLNSMLVVHSLLLDEVNPRSVAFQFLRIHRGVNHLPGRRASNYQEPLLRLATAGISRVRLADIETLLSGTSRRQPLIKLLEVLKQIPTDITTALTATYFTHSELQRSLIQTSPMDTLPEISLQTPADETASTTDTTSSNPT